MASAAVSRQKPADMLALLLPRRMPARAIGFVFASPVRQCLVIIACCRSSCASSDRSTLALFFQIASVSGGRGGSACPGAFCWLPPDTAPCQKRIPLWFYSSLCVSQLLSMKSSHRAALSGGYTPGAPLMCLAGQDLVVVLVRRHERGVPAVRVEHSRQNRQMRHEGYHNLFAGEKPYASVIVKGHDHDRCTERRNKAISLLSFMAVCHKSRFKRATKEKKRNC